MAKKVKSFKSFQTEQNQFDRHNIWIKTVKLCESKILETVDNTELSELPKVLIDILVNINGYLYENGNLLTVDYVEDRKEPMYKPNQKEWHGKQSAYFLATKEEVKEELKHFCSYYLLDDGEVSLIDGEVQFPDYNNDTLYDENITDTGMALWILEQLGYTYPCVVSLKELNKDFVTIAETDSFTEATIALKQYIDRKGINKENCRIDNVGITGKLGIIIVPKNIFTM